jgi:DNA-binding NarL/FixJ family response regulator
VAQAGVSGYVTRDASLDHLRSDGHERPVRRDALLAVDGGRLLRCIATLAQGRTGPVAARLTWREVEVVAVIEQGLLNREIAQRLCIQVATVKNHLHHVFEKLQVRRCAEAVALARRGGLLAAAQRSLVLKD